MSGLKTPVVLVFALVTLLPFILRAQSNPTLVYPNDTLVTSSTTINFLWNPIQSATSYHLQVDDEPAFSAGISIDDPGVPATGYNAALPSGSRYYWRVRANTLIGPTGWSPIWSFVIFSPADINVTTWYKADYNVRVDGDTLVFQWDDASGNGNHAVQSDATRRPRFIASAPEINNMPLVRFSGYNEYLDFTTNLSAVRTVFWVIMENPAVNSQPIISRPVLGMKPGSPEPDFHRGYPTLDIYDEQYPSNGYARSGVTRVNGNVVNSTTKDMPQTMSVISTRTTGSCKAENLGNDRFIPEPSVGSYRVWYGDMAEIIIFNDPLSDSLIALVTRYLMDKYAPPPNLGADIVADYALCLTSTLYPGHFNSYSWSSIEVTDSIHVSNPGVYSVTVTDQFERTLVDTINVRHVRPNLIEPDTICLGDSKLWDTQLSNNYTFDWSTGATASSINITTPGNYRLTVTDTTGCTFITDNIHIGVDSLWALAGLGNDTTLCRGQSIGLTTGADLADTYLWSSGETTATIVIDTSGIYSVTVTNDFGCSATDAIQANATLTAPVANFSATTVCFGNPTTFTDNSTPPQNFTNTGWQWDFGDGNSSAARNPVYTFLFPGNHNVKLTVTAANGCVNINVKTVQVYALPQAYFNDTIVCADITRLFEDESQRAEPSIPLQTWSWDFGDGSISSQQDALKTYDTTGFYNVSLIVSDSRSCRDTFLQQVESIIPIANAAAPNLFYPQDNFTLSSSSVFFDWQASAGAAYYVLEISANSAFTNIIFSEETAADSLTASGLNGGTSYYWRVNAFNLCGSFTSSEIKLFNIFRPTNIPGLCLWLAADESQKDLFGLNNSVEKWYDLSSSGNNAFQTDEDFQPRFDTAHNLNGFPVLHFDGTDDHLLFSRIDQISTVFWVFREHSGASLRYRHVLGDTDIQPEFHRGCCVPSILNDTTRTIWGTRFTPSKVLNGITRLNGTPINGTQVNVPTQFCFLTAKPQASCTANSFVMDRYIVEPGNTYRVWDGDLAELIIYCQPLTIELIETVEDYLNDKYAPPVNLGPDIVMEYGFCTPIEICAGDQYNSYTWSTGEATACITVTSPGLYWVNVRNIFGISSYDEIVVTGGLNTITLDDTLPLCMSDTLIWDTKLAYNSPNGLDYFFEWQDNSHDSFYVITQPGQYWVTVTDNALCSVTSDTLTVYVDSFEVQASLGADTLNLCSGNRLRLIAGVDEAKNYQWSNGSTDSTLVVFASGEYSVTVENINGCMAADTVYVNIFGVAPVADFSFDKNCFSDFTEFTDLSHPNIIDWRWNFDDGMFADAQNPTHRFPDANDYNVKLVVTDAGGCYQDVIKKVVVYPLPEAKFLNELVNCANDYVVFDDTSTVLFPQNITNWQWNFGDGSSSTARNPFHLYLDEGIYPVSLTVTTDSQCSGTIYDTLEIFPELVADIKAENLCITATPQFCDNSPGFSNVAWTWEFGDGGSSTKECPTHIYIRTGSYDVSLRVRNALGCERTVTETIRITAPPTVNFDNPDFCVNQPHQFIDNTVINGGDNVVEWSWNFGDQTQIATVKNPIHGFSSSGTYSVRLDVVTQNGCESFGIKTVEVIEPPVADFDFTPPYGGAPLTVTFINQSVNAGSYLWDFGDNSPASDETNPDHTYLQNGDIIITLTASNLPGCSNIATDALQVAVARFDIAIDDIVLTKLNQNGDCTYLLDMNALVTDKSTVNITDFDIQAWSSAGGTMAGHWEGNFTNRQAVYHFNNQFLITDCDEEVVICMEVADPNGNPDENPSDNRTCVTLSDEWVILGPNPNPSGDFINLDVILPSKGVLKISNYNVIGQKLDVIGGTETDKGYHRYTFDTGYLPQGVYILMVEYRDEERILKYVVRR